MQAFKEPDTSYTNQFHAQLVSSELGMSTGWKGKATPPIWEKTLLLKLCIETASKLYLQGKINQENCMFSMCRYKTECSKQLFLNGEI